MKTSSCKPQGEGFHSPTPTAHLWDSEADLSTFRGKHLSLAGKQTCNSSPKTAYRVPIMMSLSFDMVDTSKKFSEAFPIWKQRKQKCLIWMFPLADQFRERPRCEAAAANILEAACLPVHHQKPGRIIIQALIYICASVHCWASRCCARFTLFNRFSETVRPPSSHVYSLKPKARTCDSKTK